MAEDSRPPVAIRISRPYENEDDFLARELETLNRTSITLLGAQSRPQGVVLRFELTLASGAPLVRGEGRVTSYKEGVFEGLSGLTLRFTRLDSKSKALVDKAAALRDARGRMSAAPAAIKSTAPKTSRPAPAQPRIPAPAPLGTLALELPALDLGPTPLRDESPALDLEKTRAEAPTAKRSERPAPLDLESTRAEAPRAKRSERPPAPMATTPVAAPSDRNEKLARLRTRAKSLTPEAVQAILERGKRP